MKRTDHPLFWAARAIALMLCAYSLSAGQQPPVIKVAPGDAPPPAAVKDAVKKTNSDDSKKVHEKVDKKAKAEKKIEVKTAPAAKANVRVRVGAGAANDTNAMVKEFEKEFEKPFNQMYVSELHFMRMACQPTKQQFEKIAEKSKPDLKAVVKEHAQQRVNGQMNGRVFPGGGNGRPDPRGKITSLLSRAAKDFLSSEQAAKYQKELDLRVASHKRAIAKNLVVMIDKVLFLTTDQRGKLEIVLQKNWNDAWNEPQWFQMDGSYFPPMPDGQISPLLTPPQWSVWAGIPKGQVFFGHEEQLDGGFEIVEGPWDERPGEKKAPASTSIKAADNGATRPVEKK